MTDNLSLFQYSLQERTLHELAKACWGDYVTSISIFADDEKFLSVETTKLIAHRKSIVRKIPRIFTSLPKALRDHLVDAVVYVQKGYSEALVFTNMYRNEIKLMTAYPLSSGPYAAKNFIDPTGCFDELGWARCFVIDENQSVFRRFELACLYCFEDVIRYLWSSIRNIGRLTYEGSFTHVENRYGCMVWMWAHHLEKKFDPPTEFYSVGFIEASERGFEHAARFFWKGCPDPEKEQLMRDMDEFDLRNEDLFSDPSQFKYDGHARFFYSLLSPDQKSDLIELISPLGAHYLWSRLLFSRFYEIVLRDILIHHRLETSSLTYAHLLRALTVKMVELPTPVYKKIFEALWRSLSKTDVKSILRMDLNIIRNLTEIRATDLLKLVIPPLSKSEKDFMLIHDWQFAGISAFPHFLIVGDLDGLRRYLSLFLTNRYRMQIKVRTDAIDFLEKFYKAYNDFLWRDGSECARKQVNEVIESVRMSLCTLDFLLEL